MTELKRIANLLRSPDAEKQIAAAIVLAELGVKTPEVALGLGQMLRSGSAVLQRHALDAAALLSVPALLPDAIELLHVVDPDLRQRALDVVIASKRAALPALRRAHGKAEPGKRRALEEAIAQLGGEEALQVVLEGIMAAAELETARALALQFRQSLKHADVALRKKYLSVLKRFLGLKSTQKSRPALVGGIKIVGLLELTSAAPLLFSFASNKYPAEVQQEALIGLRFCAAEDPRLVDVLLEASQSTEPTLAQTGLHALAGLEPTSRMTERLAKLALGLSGERVRFVLEILSRSTTEGATRALVSMVIGAKDRGLAEHANTLLSRRENAASPALAALVVEASAERAWMLRQALRGKATSLPKAAKTALLQAALASFEKGGKTHDALLDAAREADPVSFASGLRVLADKFRKTKKLGQAITACSMVARMEGATLDDRYALAVLLLSQGKRDLAPSARAGDEALRALETLAVRGVDVATRLKKERSLDLEAFYYIGFHFIERQHLLGEDMLALVVEKAGRTKLGKMAKNKLSLAARAESLQ